MKYFSCFSGIGGFELGIIQAYESNNEYASICTRSQQEECSQGRELTSDKFGALLHAGDMTAPLCVGFSEIDKYATQIYQSHFPNHTPYGDITKINTDELPDFDCIVGGFPCQSFSIAGKRRGFEDTRGTLFFELARILRAKQPRLFVFENVKGLLSHDNGKTFSTIIATLDELGYDCQWQVLNSKNHGVPQNRERVFIVGHLRGTGGPQVFPIHTTMYSDLASTALDANYWKGIDNHGARKGIAYSQKEWDKPDDSNRILRTTYSDGMRIRRLTPTECERLQGFPDGWTQGVSDSQRYKCLGNAVTVNVIRDIFAKLNEQ